MYGYQSKDHHKNTVDSHRCFIVSSYRQLALRDVSYFYKNHLKNLAESVMNVLIISKGVCIILRCFPIENIIMLVAVCLWWIVNINSQYCSLIFFFLLDFWINWRRLSDMIKPSSPSLLFAEGIQRKQREWTILLGALWQLMLGNKTTMQLLVLQESSSCPTHRQNTPLLCNKVDHSLMTQPPRGLCQTHAALWGAFGSSK